MKSVSHVLSTVSYVVIGVTLFFILLIGYWLVSARDVLVINKEPVPIRTIKENPTSNIVILELNYCKKKTVDGRVRISLVSKTREIFLPMGTDREASGCKVTEVPIILPKDIPTDTYHMHFRIIYKMNPIRQVIEEFDSKDFEVVD